MTHLALLALLAFTPDAAAEPPPHVLLGKSPEAARMAEVQHALADVDDALVELDVVLTDPNSPPDLVQAATESHASAQSSYASLYDGYNWLQAWQARCNQIRNDIAFHTSHRAELSNRLTACRTIPGSCFPGYEEAIAGAINATDVILDDLEDDFDANGCWANVITIP